MDPTHEHIYHLARCYDVAFGFRDVAAECATLSALATKHLGRNAKAVLELAAGPARHAREFARRGAAAIALDAVQAMCDYALERAHENGVALTVVCADMCAFQLPQHVDLAFLLMDSASYLLDRDAILRRLDCVAAHLVDGGLYVLEMSHPRDAFGVGRSTESRWTSEENGLRVDMQWGAESDPFDPITQIDEVTVRMRWSGPDGDGEIIDRARQRRITATELDALVRAHASFDIVEWLGALAPPVPLSNDLRSWRMVPVLRKRPAA